MCSALALWPESDPQSTKTPGLPSLEAFSSPIHQFHLVSWEHMSSPHPQFIPPHNYWTF